MKKLKTLVLVGALGGVVAAIAKRLQAGEASSGSSWQSAGGPSGSGSGATPSAVADTPEETLVDNAPAPAGMPDLPDSVMPDAAGPQSTSELPEGASAPDPLTDPLPEFPGEDEPRP